MYGFEAVIFDGKRTARKALDTLEDSAPVYGWIDDVAIVSRNKLGFISIHSTWAQDDRAVGARGGWGMVTGALVGPDRRTGRRAGRGGCGRLYGRADRPR
jgi:hypothetical protein